MKRLWITAFIIFLLDQYSKFKVTNAFSLGETEALTNFVSLTYIQNTGITFGLFQGYPYVMIAITIAVIALILYKVHELTEHVLGFFAVGLIIGGAFGNLLDRIRFGAVTDFIDFHFWPAFNLADTAIVVGALILVWLMWND